MRALVGSALLLVLLLLPLLGPPGLAAQAPRDEARTVYVGVFLRDVSSFEQRDGVFDADFDMWAKWRGELDRDAIRIANAAEVEQEFEGEDTDGSWHSARWRVRGTLRGEFPLHRFPFDRQELPLVFELVDVHGRLVPDLASSSMAARFSVTDWLYEPTFHPATSSRELASDLGHLTHEGRPTTVHQVAFRVLLRRPLAPVVLKLFLPLVIIILVALASLFLHPEQVEARSGMAVTALLSCFAFQFTVADSLPAVTYVTLADTLFLIGYVLSGTTVGLTILTTGLVRAGRDRAAVWVDRAMRVAMPLAGLLAVLVAVPEEPAAAAEQSPPIPEMTRGTSSRERLRIGTNILGSVSGSPLAFASSWGLVHEDPIDGEQVVYVERAPGVGNDSLQLMAGGGMQVTWTLREGARWSDGEPLTSADLAFAHEMSPDPEIEEVSAPDERTWVVRWRHTLARALEAPEASPEHAYRPIFEEGGYDAVREHMRAHPYPTLGPYRLSEWREGERLVADANPHFPGAAAGIPHVELVHVDRDDIVAAFERGDVDMAVPNAITPEQARALASERPDVVFIRPSALFVYLDLDLEVPALARLEVRRALLAAIDRDALVRAVYEEHGRVAHVPVPGDLPEGVEPVAHDPSAARAALEALGAPLSLPLYLTSSEVDVAIADRLEADLGAIGVAIERRVVASTLAVRREGHHGGLVLSITRGARDSSPQRWWGIEPVDGRYPPDARNAAFDDDVHRLVEREERAIYPERREQLRDALFAAYARRLPTLPLMFAAERVLMVPELRGWDLPADVPFGRGLEHFWLAEPAER